MGNYSLLHVASAVQIALHNLQRGCFPFFFYGTAQPLSPSVCLPFALCRKFHQCSSIVRVIGRHFYPTRTASPRTAPIFSLERKKISFYLFSSSKCLLSNGEGIPEQVKFEDKQTNWGRQEQVDNKNRKKNLIKENNLNSNSNRRNRQRRSRGAHWKQQPRTPQRESSGRQRQIHHRFTC